MSTPAPTRIAAALPAECRSQLMELAQEVNFAEGTRLFREGGHADRFWIVRSGTVTLDVEGEIREAVLAELAPDVTLDFVVQAGVVTLRGPLQERAMVPLLARAIRAVEGVVDVRMELDRAIRATA